MGEWRTRGGGVENERWGVESEEREMGSGE